ncbi:MAG: 50S ribosomal protein L10 [Candidatus Magasanikbacteria bacterium RIFCSPHIGHO2_01_FULL_50_8]|uniref:Large ribosomal subunit protein uL10 n=2 Tax=Candidatus Magasanikiibacteriota TaxID=1752731 RepID=A0A1F6LMK4_9BACT|nr:MAG: 50S ribosomal protein L10 [Candidatus Magasanikbacteria bacterium RIFCSPHIGHO2_01_FULL_50_8]OGH68267.1 MAG: 50S ribosomal protein L10 [Candidatus Magasanikbacteria bacterium RIFCSPHIGHO2_02_FULL_50_9b]
MAKTKAQKSTDLQRLTNAFKASKAAVFVDYKGITVKNVNRLRRNAEKANVEYMVAKKTLITLAARAAGLEIDAKKMDGNIAVAFGSDEVGAANVIATLGKEVEQIKIVGGTLEGKFIDANQVKALAALPSKQELLAQLARVLNAPRVGLVTTLSGITRGFVTALSQVQQKKA